mgnify:CR=1 FL=1
MEKKKIYIKPTTEVIVLHGNTTILAASLEMIAGARRWRGEVPTIGKEWGIVNAQAEAYFTHGQSASGGGNRSKGNAWEEW